jgi:SAM-dependent methyltransferase
VHWRVKGALQKALGYVPAGGHVHFQLQRRFGGLRSFGRECDLKVEDWRLMMGHLRASGVDVEGATLLEMGSGWYPTLPICLWLAGVGKVHTLDLNRHMRLPLVKELVTHLARHVGMIAETSGRPETEVEERRRSLLRKLEDGAHVGEATGGVVDYRAPADASRTGLAEATVDVVYSNSVLEHVPEAVIEACFREASRILKPGAIVFHSVNCGDHYAYMDGSISQLNYLRYSDAAWEKWNNAFLYQNRLRAEDFIRMAKEAGFAIEIDTSRPHPKRLAELEAIDVHPRFARYSKEQLAITSVDFVGRKAKANEARPS